MLIKIYIFTIIFFLLSILSFMLRYADYIDKEEGVKVGKIKRFIWSIESIIKLRLLLIALIPVINIAFTLFYIYASDDVLEDLHNKSKEKIKEKENE